MFCYSTNSTNNKQQEVQKNSISSPQNQSEFQLVF